MADSRVVPVIESPAAAVDKPAPRPRWSSERWRLIGLVALVGLPVAIGMIVAQTWTWYPPSDYGLIELSTRDVGTHTPLVGPFSRFGWNHPGPLLFWTLAPPYRLFGAEPAGLFVGAGSVNLAAIGASATILYRRGRWPLLLLGGLGTALLLRGLGGFFVVDPWNPSVTVLVFLAFVLLVWSLALGAYRVAPAVALAGSFVAQTHLGYVPLVAALLVPGVVGLGIWAAGARHRRGWRASRRRLLLWSGLAVLVGVVCWSGPIAEQLTEEPGNMGQLVDHFRANEEAPAGAGRALEIVARHLAPTGAWLTGVEPTDVFTGNVAGLPAVWSLPMSALLVVAVVVAVRRRDRTVLWLQAVLVTGLVAGTVAIARTTGDTFPYLFNWMRVLAMLTVVSSLWSFHRALDDHARERLRRPGAIATVGAIAVLSLVTSVSVLRTGLPYAEFSDAVQALAPPTVAAIGDTPVLLKPIGECWDEVPTGLLLEVEKQGGTIVVPPELEHRFGDHRVFDGTNAEELLTVGCRDAAPYEPPPGAGRLVAYHGELTPDEDARFQELADEIRAQLVAAGREDLLASVATIWITVVPDSGVDPELLDEYEPLVAAAQDRSAVYLGPLPVTNG